MAADPTVFLLKSYHYLPSQDADSLLGRIVKNYHSPNDNSAPREPKQYDMYGAYTTELQNFNLSASSTKKSWASILAEHVASIQWVGEGDTKVGLEGKRLWSRRLREHDEFFEAVKEDKEVIAKVPKWIGPTSSHVCLIVGVYLCEDIDASNSSRHANSISAEAGLPVGTAAAIAMGSPVPTTAGNVTVEGGSKLENEKNFQAVGSGQYVFGLELKLVTRKRFYNSAQLKLADKAPKIIAGRTLGSEESENQSSSEDDTEEDIDAKLVDINDELTEKLYEACLLDTKE